MTIEIKKEVKENIEVTLPSWYKDDYANYFINRDGVIISARRDMLTINKPSEIFYASDVAKIIANAKVSTKQEFDNAYYAALAKITECLFTPEPSY